MPQSKNKLPKPSEGVVSISRLKKGNIYAVRYRRYRVDPNPVILVLWAGARKTHALNLNYLDASRMTEVSEFVTRYLNTIVTEYDAYSFYHRHIKHGIHSSVKVAYRTYFTAEIRNAKALTNNPLQTMSVLRGIAKARIASEVKGDKPSGIENPRPVKVVVGPTKTPEMVSDYVDMLSQLFPKKQKSGLMTKLFRKRW